MIHEKRVRLRVYGRVQGVLFRHAAKARARALTLSGWAKNEKDGSLTIVAEGDLERLRNFIQFCYTGPEGARVDRVREIWGEASGHMRSFEIVYEEPYERNV